MEKYYRPKILLIDLDADSEEVLKAAGFNISSGSFGVPYRVKISDDFVPVIPNGALPDDYSEQEIVVVNLVKAPSLSGPIGEKVTSPGDPDWWIRCKNGIVDPRPRVMTDGRMHFDRILSHGGIFIVFADQRFAQELILGYRDRYGLHTESTIDSDNWSFLSILEPRVLNVNRDSGQEIIPLDNGSSFRQAVCDHLNGSRFLCTLQPNYWMEKKDWTTLATNKYGEPVAVAIASRKGLVLIFPQFRDTGNFLRDLFVEVLPNLRPQLFPYFEGAQWLERPEYELPTVLELQERIRVVQDEARRKVNELTQSIDEKRRESGYLHDLVTQTGHPLVSAVKTALEVIGFRNVVDVDEEMRKMGDTGAKREDLRIGDESPVLLVEVKGLSSLPKDAAALQVSKYVLPRIREWDRRDIQGLEIINHQKNIPPLERENIATFRQEIVVNAEEQKFGLLTTWDLCRLVRSFLKNNWRYGQVKGVFYRAGRIDPTPMHYQPVGTVERFWEKAGAIGVRLTNGRLREGDRVAFELPVEFEEQNALSLQVDNVAVVEATPGQLVAIKTHLTKEQARKGIRVFKVSSEAN